jgi:L-threonylcarbamoyladenylate synthase
MVDDIKNALKILREGGTILYPTDTIWGIGCDATNVEAVEKVYKIKKRNESKSMIILLDDAGWLTNYVEKVPDIAFDLIELAEKPLTIIYPNAKNLAKNLVALDGSIAIRIVRDEFCKKLISQFRKPLVSTSANISNQSPPANFDEINQKILNAVDYVVKWRQDDFSRNSPSGIIKLGINNEVQVIRN